MIQAKEVQEGRMQIVHMNLIFHGSITEFIGGTIRSPRLDSTSCQPCCETTRVVVTSIAAL